MNILILTGRFGLGHWSASQSLRQQLLAEFPDAAVTVEDFFQYAGPNASEAVYKLFSLLVTYGGGIYNAYYKWTENSKTGPGAHAVPFFQDKLRELISARGADVVVATHPLCAQIAARYKTDTGDTLPLVTCVTDLSSHSEWISSASDFYLVGSFEIKRRLVEKGVKAEDIFVTGIPVGAEFRAAAGRHPPEGCRLLIMGGGLGLMPKKNRFYEALNELPGVRTTVLTGKNERLLERLSGKYPNIEAVGFTHRVHAYMARADLMLTKPGGITLFETIYSELPLLAWAPFLQQEVENARFILRTGIGRLVGKETEDCIQAIRALIYDDEALSRMSANMRRLKRQLEREDTQELHTALAEGRGACVRG